MKKILFTIIVLITLFLSSCGVLQTGNSYNLNGTDWSLVSYNGNPLLPGTAMTASFENQEVNGAASCNHYFGSYKTKGDQIQIDGLGWTEMACPEPEGIMKQEQELMALFAQATTIAVEGEILQITTINGVIMTFIPIDGNE